MRLISIITITAALSLSACAQSVANDPVYLALKANPPTSIPARHLPKLRKGRFSCDVFNEGKASQYMTCWWPGGLPSSAAYLSYYSPGIPRPHPSKIMAPGGQPITEYMSLN